MKKTRDTYTGQVLGATLLLGILSACASGKMSSQGTPALQELSTIPISIRVDLFEDARVTAPSRTIGHIAETVFDISGDQLDAGQEVAALVTENMRRKISSAGYKVVSDGSADFVVSGQVRELRLDIGARDELTILLEARLTDTSRKVVWSGAEEKKADRYAGVSGNTRSSILRFLDKGLSELSATTVAEISAVLQESMPGAFSRQGKVPTSPSSTKGAVHPNKAIPVDGEAGDSSAVPNLGRLAIRTVPSRTRVVVDDIYQGLAPLDLNMAPGVHQVVIRSEGFRSSSEKVSVRKGETTEYEVTLEK